MNIDLKELKNEKEINKRERMKFVKFWADYIRTHSDKDWSEQQIIVIDSQIKGAHSLIKEDNKKN